LYEASQGSSEDYYSFFEKVFPGYKAYIPNLYVDVRGEEEARARNDEPLQMDLG
jgi:hypothetical protein